MGVATREWRQVSVLSLGSIAATARHCRLSLKMGHIEVREDFMSGVRSGVNGTSTFFINAGRYDGPHDHDSLLAAIANAAR